MSGAAGEGPDGAGTDRGRASADARENVPAGRRTGAPVGMPSGELPGDIPGSTIAAELASERGGTLGRGAADGSGGHAGTGLSAAGAKWLERAIIGTCVVAILMIFQPFSLPLFSVGCGLVVLGALAFNLVPFCRPGVTARQLGKVVLIVLIVLGVAALLGIGTAFLYVENLGALR